MAVAGPLGVVGKHQRSCLRRAIGGPGLRSVLTGEPAFCLNAKGPGFSFSPLRRGVCLGRSAGACVMPVLAVRPFRRRPRGWVGLRLPVLSTACCSAWRAGELPCLRCCLVSPSSGPSDLPCESPPFLTNGQLPAYGCGTDGSCMLQGSVAARGKEAAWVGRRSRG